MKISQCLYCYQPLHNAVQDYHEVCAKKMFGLKKVPFVDFDLLQIEDLARQIVSRSIAVTGVQRKLSLALEKKSSEVSRLTIVGLHGQYILKPSSPDYPELPQNEDVTMHLAGLVKIQTAEHCLIRLASGELAYITKRFDRIKAEKLAVEDFCQLSENLTEHKYRGSIEKVAKITYQFSANKGFEVLRLFELVLFCFLTGNADMHLKNFALFESTAGDFALSPAYDLINTALVMPNDKEETALTINGKKNRLTRSDFDALAMNLNINPKTLERIYGKFKNALPLWIAFVNQSFLSTSMKNKYVAILESRHRQLFGSLG